MNLYSKILASYYLKWQQNRIDYKEYSGGRGRFDYGPYMNSIILLLMSHTFSALCILHIYGRLQHLDMSKYFNVFTISVGVWFVILLLIYPKNKMDDLAEKFKNIPGIDTKYWRRISYSFVFIPFMLYFIEVIFSAMS